MRQQTNAPVAATAPAVTRRLTMHDVARAAGVSVSTVSRVMNNGDYIRDGTRAKVEKAITELGFRPNQLAQKLRPGQRSDTIALIIEDVSNPFYSSIAHGVHSVAQEQGHLLILGATGGSFEQECSLLDELVRRRVDGLLVVPTSSDRSQIDARIGAWAPIVFIDRPSRGAKIDAVLLDNYHGARHAVERLIAEGHRRIAYLGGYPAAYTGGRRLAGYRRALADAGVDPDPSLISLHNNVAAKARAAAARLITADNPPTALFADNNRMTVGALQAIKHLDVRVELSGFDDVELAELLDVPINLVTYDAVEMGRCAAELLFARIAGDDRPVRRIILPTELISRAALSAGENRTAI